MIPYNKKLISNARALRKNMTPEEKHLWYDFLKKLPCTVNRQKNIGNFIVDFYIASKNIENPYYDGGLLNKGTMPKYYSMDNSVRLTVLNDGTIGCELVDNANDVIALI